MIKDSSLQKSIDDAKFITELNLDAVQTGLLHTLLSSLRFFQDTCLEKKLSIHDISKELLKEELYKTMNKKD